MDNDFSHFKQTADALHELENNVKRLQVIAETKKDKINNLKKYTMQSINQIDALINKLNPAGTKNGSGNNNN